MSDLLDKFFAPVSKGTASSGAVGGAVAGVDPLRLDYSILPPFADDDSTAGEDAWDTVYVAEIPLPPIGSGSSKLTCPIKIKVDKASKTGAAKPIVKVTGGEAIEGTIAVTFVQEALPAMVAAAVTLYPGAGPFPIRHPLATMAKLDHIQITGWANPPTPDDHGLFTWKLEYLQVSIAAQNGKGNGSAVKTPKKSEPFEQPGDIDGIAVAALGPDAEVLPNGSIISADGETATKATNSGHKGLYAEQKEAAVSGAHP